MASVWIIVRGCRSEEPHRVRPWMSTHETEREVLECIGRVIGDDAEDVLRVLEVKHTGVVTSYDVVFKGKLKLVIQEDTLWEDMYEEPRS